MKTYQFCPNCEKLLYHGEWLDATIPLAIKVQKECVKKEAEVIRATCPKCDDEYNTVGIC